ncbi:MAG: CopD family protein, partial [Frankia sp.]|nr:CopD family protein [Frankia sp.]
AGTAPAVAGGAPAVGSPVPATAVAAGAAALAVGQPSPGTRGSLAGLANTGGGGAGAAGEDARPWRPSLWVSVELGALAIAVTATMALVGHAAAGSLPWLAATSVSLHLIAMSVWLGGLAVLAAALLGPRARAAELAGVLPRWSRIAMAAVATLVVTGAYQAWREVGTPPALVDTEYGQLLLYKLWFVLAMLGLGALAQRWVARHHGQRASRAADEDGGEGGPGAEATAQEPDPAAVGVLRRGVLVEAVVGVAVLAITAAMVNRVPGRTAYAPPLRTTAVAGPLTVDVRVSPTKVGPQTIDLTVRDPRGQPQRVVEAIAELTLPGTDGVAAVGPLPVPVSPVDTGRLVATDVVVPLPGEWQLTVTVRINDFDRYTATVPYRVR